MRKFLFILVPFIVLTMGILFEGWLCIGICLMLLVFDSLLGFIMRRHQTANIYTIKIKYSNFIPKNTMYLIFGTLYLNKEVFTNDELNHKIMHKIQGMETGFFLMYVLYLIEYVVKFIIISFRTKYFILDETNIFKKTFNSISFEQEAQSNVDKNKRKNYNWTQYINKIN